MLAGTPGTSGRDGSVLGRTASPRGDEPRNRCARCAHRDSASAIDHASTCGDRNSDGARLLLDCGWGHDCYSKKSSNRAPKVGDADALTMEEPPRMTGQNYYTSPQSRHCFGQLG